MNRSLEEMIKSYSDELMDYARAHNSESLVLKNIPSEGTKEASEVPEETAEVPMQTAEEVYEEPEQRDEAEKTATLYHSFAARMTLFPLLRRKLRHTLLSFRVCSSKVIRRIGGCCLAPYGNSLKTVNKTPRVLVYAFITTNIITTTLACQGFLLFYFVLFRFLFTFRSAMCII